MKFLKKALHLTREKGISTTSKEIGRFVQNAATGRGKYYLNFTRYGESMPEIYQILSVDPDDINHMLVPSFSNNNKYSTLSTYIIGGDWDNRISDQKCINPPWFSNQFTNEYLVSFNNFEYYNAAKEYLIENIDWGDTNYYQKYVELANKKNTVDYKYPKKNLEIKRKKLEFIHQKMKHEGYRSQRNLIYSNEVQKSYLHPPEFHEIRVNIGRSGEIIFDDGRHRFIISKILNIDKIPVRVVARHKKWQDIRYEFAMAESITELSKNAKQYINHPDLKDVTDNSWLLE